MKQFRLLLAVIAAAAAVAACGGGSQDPSKDTPDATPMAPADLPTETVAQINQLLQEKEARSSVDRKIASQLLYAQSGRFEATVAKPGMATIQAAKDGVLQSLLQYDSEGRVLADVKGDIGGGLQRKIEDLGGAVVATSEEHHAARAWLRLDSLQSLAGAPMVSAVRPAFLATTAQADSPYGVKVRMTRAERVAKVQEYLAELRAQKAAAKPGQMGIMAVAADGDGSGAATNAGSVNSAGGTAHAADTARKFYAADGTGVTVGVLSDSDDFKEQSIASGDLPADTITIPGQDGRPGSGEGTAMMEIVHDVAPGAKIVFASAFNSPESFADNIRQLRFTYHCDIIVDDVIYYFENPYQDDIIATAVDDVTNDGGLYFSSAGNFGNFDDGTSGTWEGDFKAGGVLSTLPSGYTVHDFGAKVISNRIELDAGPVYLHWSDAGSLDVPKSGNDYDLFVLTPDLRSVAVASTDVQDGDDIPFEFLGFIIPADYRVVVAKKAGAQTRALHLVAAGGELGISTDGSTYGHNSTIDAVAVGAVDVAQASGGVFPGGPTTQVELYSSDGNRRQFYFWNGQLISSTGATFASGAGETHKTPVVSGADGVATTLPGNSGLNPFFGTSAAAPHVAAVAALIKSALPTATAVKIKNALKSGATDIEADGVDRDSGSGVVNAMKSMQAAGAKPAVFLELGLVGVTPTSGTTLNPGGSASITIQLINNGGLAASNVVGKLTSSTPGVTVTQGTSSYANIAAGGGNQLNSAPYTITVDSSVPCGTKLSLTETVTFTGKGTSPTVFSIPVQTGGLSPTPTNVSFTGPRVAIPDNNAAGANVTFPVAGFGAVSDVVLSIDGTSCSSAVGATTVGIDHTWVGDLVATLRSPSGTTVTLFSRMGGTGNSGNNLCQTVLTDAATSSIQNVAIAGAPFTGSFKPASPLAAFAGETADGNWTLNVADLATIDTGGIRAATLSLRGYSCGP